MKLLLEIVGFGLPILMLIEASFLKTDYGFIDTLKRLGVIALCCGMLWVSGQIEAPKVNLLRNAKIGLAMGVLGSLSAFILTIMVSIAVIVLQRKTGELDWGLLGFASVTAICFLIMLERVSSESKDVRKFKSDPLGVEDDE